MYFNKIILLGRLVRDPEIKFTPSGLAISKFTLATSRVNKKENSTTEGLSSSNRNQSETLYIDINAFSTQAELISKFLKKGSLILVEGRLKFNK
jgi:single-strand DNA-binding protein